MLKEKREKKRILVYCSFLFSSIDVHFLPASKEKEEKNAGEFTVHSLPTGIGLYVLFFPRRKKSTKRTPVS